MTTDTKDNAPLLSCKDLHLSVRSDEGPIEILKGIDLDLYRGEVLGIAGESGCGKSTLIRAILGILPRQAEIRQGSITLNGNDLLARGRAASQRLNIGFIPQDPWLAMNPLFRVGRMMMEVLRWTGLPGEPPRPITYRNRARYRKHLVSLLRAVQLPDPEGSLDRYPHQFSGGQRQRILIASALASRPQVLLADEPTTALDVTTQLQILILLQRLVEEFDTAMLFVTHDFGVIAQLCDRVAVMQSGKIVEVGATRQVIDEPRHEYTRTLIASHPDRAGAVHRSGNHDTGAGVKL